MDDLISRQVAISRAVTIPMFGRDIRVVGVSELESLPSAQPEIIRCAECKWFQCNMSMDGYLPKGVDEFECRHWCGSCDPVDFCSQAERREE